MVGIERVALLSYGGPGNGAPRSTNLGDYMQTYAVLHLWETTWRSLKKPCPQIKFIDRDGKIEPEDDELALIYGWYMHPLDATGVFAFPPQRSKAIVFSLHIAAKQILTEVALRWLKERAPIGCRDFRTLDLLRSLDVPSFYSGCATLALPESEWCRTEREQAAIAIDCPHRAGDGYRDQMMKPVHRGITAEAGLEMCRILYSRLCRSANVRTSRLHVALPALAAGCHVTLVAPDGDGDRKDWGPPGRFAPHRDAIAGRYDWRPALDNLKLAIRAVAQAAARGSDTAKAWKDAASKQVVVRAKTREGLARTVEKLTRENYEAFLDICVVGLNGQKTAIAGSYSIRSFASVPSRYGALPIIDAD